MEILFSIILKLFSIVPDHLTVSPSDTRASKALKDKIEKVDI